MSRYKTGRWSTVAPRLKDSPELLTHVQIQDWTVVYSGSTTQRQCPELLTHVQIQDWTVVYSGSTTRRQSSGWNCWRNDTKSQEKISKQITSHNHTQQFNFQQNCGNYSEKNEKYVKNTSNLKYSNQQKEQICIASELLI